MKVCYFGTYEAGYDRNRILISGLRQNGVEVIPCHVPLWEGLEHKTGSLKHPWRLAKLAASVALGYIQLLVRYARTPDHDVVIVGYLGHLDALLAKPLAWLRDKPVVLDVFISLYDTLVLDRQLFGQASVAARAARALDRWCCRAADLVLLDTDAHIRFFADVLGLPREKFRHILAGADDTVFYTTKRKAAIPSPFVVFHYSKFAPLHGIAHLLDAAEALRNESDIRFLLVGSGQLEQEVERRVGALNLPNVELRSWMQPEDLRETIQDAGACLGIFGDSGKAGRVIPNKVYQCLAAGGAVITRDSEGARELLTDGDNALLCKAADGAAIAAAILRLKMNPVLQQRLRRRGREVFLRRATPWRLGADLKEHLEALLSHSKERIEVERSRTMPRDRDSVVPPDNTPALDALVGDATASQADAEDSRKREDNCDKQME